MPSPHRRSHGKQRRARCCLPAKNPRSFVRRAGRTTTGQTKALAELGEHFIVPYQAQLLDASAAFGRQAPLILEIGFGMGEATTPSPACAPKTTSCAVKYMNRASVPCSSASANKT